MATNDLDSKKYPDTQMLLELLEYKNQQKAVRRFRFLKDPWFIVDFIFLKLPHRIEALMMLMSLCLTKSNFAMDFSNDGRHKPGPVL